jgi:hypothetical protein
MGRPGAWKPGQSGNPNGRPRKGKCLSDALQKRLKKKREDGRTSNQAIVDRLVTAAEEGDLRAIEGIFNRLEGTPTQSIEHTGPSGGPLLIGRMSDEEIRELIHRVG